MPQPPTLSEEAKQRLLAIKFSFKHGVPLACEAFKISPATLYRWRRRYNARKLETLEDRVQIASDGSYRGSVDPY